MFTSRLPKSTSARRPSNPNDGSTDFYNSNIPVSVRKANLFTPQPKRSLQNGTFSNTAGKPYMTTDKKYQRPSKPVPDRDEQVRMFESLVDFLRKNAPTFPLPEAKRFFSSVSTTETSRIFEFLISRLVPEFKINKLEIDVPEALTGLDYPYIRSVTKSALVSITTRQAIVNLLVIFNWLVDLNKEANAGDSLEENLSEDQSCGTIVSGVLSNSKFPSDDARRASQQNAKKYLDDVEMIKEECTALAEDLEEIEKYNIRVQELEDDSNECKSYNDKMKKYMSVKTEEVATVQGYLLELANKSDEFRRKHEILLPNLIVDTQEQSICDSSTLARSTETIKSFERELESEKRIAGTKIAQNLRQMKEDQDKLARSKDMSTHQDTKLTEEISVESSKLGHDKSEDAKIVELKQDYLRNSLESYREEAIASVKKAEIEQELWTGVEQVFSQNYKIAKSALNLFIDRRQ